MRTGQTPARPGMPAPRTGETAQIRVMPGRTQTAWEAAIASILTPGDRVLVVGGGPAQRLWAGLAIRAGLEVEVIEAPTDAAVTRHLGADRFGAIRAVFAVQDGTGAAPEVAAVRRALDGTFHDALLLVDASGAPCPDLAACHVDVLLGGAREGLAGLLPRHPIAAA